MSDFWMGLGFTVLSGAWTYLFAKTQSHETRIQTCEQLQGQKIENLIKDVEELKKNIKELAEQFHKDKNAENAKDATLKALLMYLERKEGVSHG